ncbi:hypothetical protein QBC44DRAFT_309093 [Cladorrhinum sp. PSN332]|nr:hypothetical protein QBC44DRAFT_309093 [Cladorrhinum sp. PSN332]
MARQTPINYHHIIDEVFEVNTPFDANQARDVRLVLETMNVGLNRNTNNFTEGSIELLADAFRHGTIDTYGVPTKFRVNFLVYFLGEHDILLNQLTQYTLSRLMQDMRNPDFPLTHHPVSGGELAQNVSAGARLTTEVISQSIQALVTRSAKLYGDDVDGVAEALHQEEDLHRDSLLLLHLAALRLNISRIVGRWVADKVAQV